VAVDQLNTYDVLAADDVVFTQGAYDAFVGGTASSSDQATAFVAPAREEAEVEPAPVEEKAQETTEKPAEKKADSKDESTTDEKPQLPKGAKAPLKSGGAPKGYEVKGNADSGLYHEPDGQWYDATVAEFYFKSAEDAEAAGLTRAGGGSAADDAADSEEDQK
jgi:large subunit ribosomal protein L4